MQTSDSFSVTYFNKDFVSGSGGRALLLPHDVLSDTRTEIFPVLFLLGFQPPSNFRPQFGRDRKQPTRSLTWRQLWIGSCRRWMMSGHQTWVTLLFERSSQIHPKCEKFYDLFYDLIFLSVSFFLFLLIFPYLDPSRLSLCLEISVSQRLFFKPDVNFHHVLYQTVSDLALTDTSVFVTSLTTHSSLCSAVLTWFSLLFSPSKFA